MTDDSKSMSRDEMIAIVRKKPADRLFTSSIVTIVLLAIIEAVMGMDAVSAEKYDKLANYWAAAISMLAIGLAIMWYQVPRLNQKLNAVAGFLSDESKEQKEPEPA
ncbi:MAG: hypothetical protein K8F91_21380 [Candidatus Obscuribacterales bacterium]|nr:hypothetical protein [Candidatus Obscuribacterales bacterium]